MEPLELFSPYRAMVEQELRRLLDGRTQPLYRMMEYQLGWTDEQGTPLQAQGGKRLRPILCLFSCQALGGDLHVALPMAAAVELVHNFSLIHDDIQDGNPERHHRSAVWWVWGPAQAINAGDATHALARLALISLEERRVPAERVLQALRVLDQACLSLCEGQYLDVSFQERLEVPLDEYIRMAEGKTGALFGCALELGALAAGAAPSALEAFRLAGQKLGVAFQVRDDMLDLWGPAAGKAPAGDILNKKKSFPVAYAFEKASVQEKRHLGTFYLKRVLEPGDVPPLLSMLDSLGARQASEEVAKRLKDEGLRLLREAAPQADLSPIKAMAEFMVTRVE